jgi:transposase
LEDDNLRGGPPQQRYHSALCLRPADEWRHLSGLAGEVPDPDAQSRRLRRHGQPAAHKIAQVRALIEAAGAILLYLPPYSPDLNPIEMAFAKLKALLRKAAERSVDALWDKIGEILNKFSPQECANYFRHAGYA